MIRTPAEAYAAGARAAADAPPLTREQATAVVLLLASCQRKDAAA